MGSFKDISIDVLDEFKRLMEKDKFVSGMYSRARDGTPSYADAHAFAIHAAENLKKAYASKGLTTGSITVSDAIDYIEPISGMQNLVEDYAMIVQNSLNTSAGIGVKAVKADKSMDKKRLASLAERLSDGSDDEISKTINEATVQMSQSRVDDTIRSNAKLHYEMGFSPVLIREYEGPHREHTSHGEYGDKYAEYVDCEWCKSLAGTYDYADVKASGSDVYMRHEGCRCTVTYMPSKNVRNDMSASGNAFVRW